MNKKSKILSEIEILTVVKSCEDFYLLKGRTDMEKFHHKLYVMNEYMRQTLAAAHQKSANRHDVVQFTVQQLAKDLQNPLKAKKMRKLINSIWDAYQHSKAEYNLKVAVFVSCHKVLNANDYQSLKEVLKQAA